MRFTNCTVYDASFRARALDLIVRDGVIVDLPEPGAPSSQDRPDDEQVDLGGRIVVPGFIDIHIHGAMEADTMDAELDALDRISRYLAPLGVTSFLPTTMTTPVEELDRAFSQSLDVSGAQVLGFNMEGPFISEPKRGAHLAEHIRKPTIEEFRSYKPERGILVVTVAPEVEGALDFIEAVAGQTVVSLGHSTADFDTASAAIDRGAKSLTHTFNAMPPLLHRDPGLIGAAVQRGLHAELIADTIHTHPSIIYCAYRLFGPDRLILISDSMRAAGLADGVFDLGGQAIQVRDGVARTEAGNIAGSTSNVWASIGNANAAGIPFNEVLRMATINPATLIGVDDRKGQLAAGYDADFVVLDDEHTIHSTYIAGRPFDA